MTMFQEGMIDKDQYNKIAKNLKSLTEEDLTETLPAEIPQTIHAPLEQTIVRSENGLLVFDDNRIIYGSAGEYTF